MSEYKKMPFPWVSKSKLGDLGYCKYSFWLENVSEDWKEEETREDAIEGTNLHMVFAMFYKTLKELYKENPGELFKHNFTDQLTDVHKHPFRKFIYEACMKYVKPDQREYDKYKNILRNFATIESRSWLRLNSILTNKNEIVDCFLPLKLEYRFEIEDLHMYGTIDRVGVEVLPGGTKKIAIYDYKTGNVPKQVKNHVDKGNMLGWKLPTHKSKEIHFYALAYALLTGWNVTPEIKSFLEDEKWWYAKKDGMSYSATLKAKGDYLTKLQKKYKLSKKGKILKGTDIIVGYYFLNGTDGYKPIKKFSYASLKGVYRAINEYRSVMHDKYFVKTPEHVFDEYLCGPEIKKCSKFNHCRKEVDKIYEQKSQDSFF